VLGELDLLFNPVLLSLAGDGYDVLAEIDELK
jgi:hypothetical protein